MVKGTITIQSLAGDVTSFNLIPTLPPISPLVPSVDNHSSSHNQCYIMSASTCRVSLGEFLQELIATHHTLVHVLLTKPPVEVSLILIYFDVPIGMYMAADFLLFIDNGSMSIIIRLLSC